ncbi:MAG: DUF1819 family protein [Bryobacterales bacterium]|nr:DUF1819 family protein [Bryobacterales bacterium]
MTQGTRRAGCVYLREEAANIRRFDGERPSDVRYRATIAIGSLKVAESRTIADLLLRGVNAAEWRAEVVKKNVLQIRSLETSERLAQLLRARLQLMQPELWEMVRDGSALLATHACLAAAVKHSPLLGDFLDIAMSEQYRLFHPALSNSIWEHFIEDCRSRDPGMSDWSESTVARIRSTVFAILAQAGYIENPRTLRLQTVHIAKEVLNYLYEQDEKYVLRCIGVRP